MTMTASNATNGPLPGPFWRLGMKFMRFAAGSLAAIVLTTPVVSAQDRAADVMAAARKAIGAEKLNTFQTLTVVAKTARNIGDRQMTSTVELLVDAPDKYARIEDLTTPIARTSVSGFNGETAIRPAGTTMGRGGVVMFSMGPGGAAAPGASLSPEEEDRLNAMLLRSQRAEITRLMLGWLAMPHPGVPVTFTYAGEAESPDGKAHVIDVAGEGLASRLFIDQATNLPLMLTFQGPKPRVMTMRGPAPGRQGGAPDAEMRRQVESAAAEPPEMVENYVYFSDWRKVDGIQFPHVMQRAVDGETVEEWDITRVRLNAPIAPDKFR